MDIQQIVNELNFLEEKGNWSTRDLNRVNELENMFINHALADNYGIDFKKGTFYLKSWETRRDLLRLAETRYETRRDSLYITHTNKFRNGLIFFHKILIVLIYYSTSVLLKKVQGDTKFIVANLTIFFVSIATFFNCYILLRSIKLVLFLMYFLIFLKM